MASQPVIVSPAAPPCLATPSTGHAQFLSAAATHSYRLQGEEVVLRQHPDVFPPSAFGLNFAERVDFSDCRRAADIGAGSGLLAILASLKGVPDVTATDSSVAALRLTDSNARDLNGVAAIHLRLGHLFCDLQGPFDVITANLPQEIIPPGYRDGLSPLQQRAIDGGGHGGNAILLDFLDVASRYMHNATRLYVIVNTITDYRATLRRIAARFSACLIWQGSTATKSFVRDNIGFFRELMDDGTVALTQDEAGGWRARQLIYRLGLKK